jgi:hypothetical protein
MRCRHGLAASSGGNFLVVSSQYSDGMPVDAGAVLALALVDSLINLQAVEAACVGAVATDNHELHLGRRLSTMHEALPIKLFFG